MSQFFMKFLGDTTSSVKELIPDLTGSTSSSQKKTEQTLTSSSASSPDVDVYSNLKKPTVLQDARCFNDTQINERRCRQLLSYLIYLINQV